MSELAQAQTTFRDSWTIRQATAFLLFGDPERELPDRHEAAEDIAFGEISARRVGKEYDRLPPFDRKPLKPIVDRLTEQMNDPRDEGSSGLLKRAAVRCLMKTLLHRAEETLIGDLQARQVVAVGRLESDFSPGKAKRSEHQEIPPLALLGHITLNSILEPPSESWLVVRDPALPGPEKAWRDVKISQDDLRRLHPVSLTNSWKEMLDGGAGLSTHGNAAQRKTVGTAAGCANAIRTGARLDKGTRLVPTSSPHPQFCEAPEFSESGLRGWFKLRVGTWVSERPPPTERQDMAAAESHFQCRISRDKFREIRRSCVPKEWRKRGPRRPR